MELKFKVLDLDTGKVYEPEDIDRIGFLEGKPERVTMINKDVEKSPIIYNFKLLQFTGEKDKNGEELYDGDEVKFHYFYACYGSECEHELTGIIKRGRFGWALEAIKGEHWKGYTGYEDGEGCSTFLDLCAMNEGSIHEESFEKTGSIYDEEIKTP